MSHCPFYLLIAVHKNGHISQKEIDNTEVNIDDGNELLKTFGNNYQMNTITELLLIANRTDGCPKIVNRWHCPIIIDSNNIKNKR